MSNLVRYDNDNLELVINTDTGESYSSVGGYARMTGLSQSAISKRKSRQGITDLVKADVPTPGGIQTMTLLPESLIADWVVKDNPKLATQMLKAGVRVFLHTMAGYQVSSTATQALPPSDVRVTQLFGTLERLGCDLGNPRLQQAYQDLAHNMLGIKSTEPQLQSKEVELKGVAELAEDLGYPAAQVVAHRSRLGKWVKQSVALDPVKEKRLVNGTFREVNLYPANHPQVVEAIASFFQP